MDTTFWFGLAILCIGILCGFGAAKFIQSGIGKYITVNDARDIADDYSEEIVRLEDVIMAEAGKHRHYINEPGYPAQPIIDHFTDEEIGFRVEIDEEKNSYRISWEEDENDRNSEVI